ncbi:hypothetical protein JCM19235_3675 [Vibrio maritimus]|uniref:Uncharacterized protein n=1 Tax=Vibrio maritimus TaxID=990268 RepID=A0A090S1J1_9VIBR|nr:hypothetical protein JCM19235_3675 [Vibrio maritimus]
MNDMMAHAGSNHPTGSLSGDLWTQTQTELLSPPKQSS